MKVQILYFDGCPWCEGAQQAVHEALARRGMDDARVDLVAVNTYEDAERLKFPGSPTIRADGEDLFPVPERSEWALGCRMYLTPEGLKGHPSAEMVEEALSRKGVTEAE
jgi:glutaredoxin